jgi:hypothetical protein
MQSFPHQNKEKILPTRLLEPAQFFGSYSGLCNNHTLCVYLFPRKILPCAFISPGMNSTMAALCIYLLLEKTLPLTLIPYCGIIR